MPRGFEADINEADAAQRWRDFSTYMSRWGDRFIQHVESLLGEELQSKIVRLGRQVNEIGIDPFGFDPQSARYLLALAALMHRRYFRTEVQGISGLPQGRVMLVANHSGQVPIDGMLLGASLILDAEPPRLPRSMVEKWSAQLPFVSMLFARSGQVVGSPENARRLLENDETLLVFPEGARGIAKPFERRYQLEPFGNGFMRLALATHTPIVPVAIIGGEEQYPSIANLGGLAKLLRMPSFPIIPQLFFGMWMPLPTRYRIHFGEAITFQGDPDDEDAVIEEKVWVVRSTIQGMLHRGLQERRSIFF